MKKFFHEFKEFALRGNVLELAVGVIIGGAFQSIVNSLVKDIISPIIGLFAKTDFNDLAINILGVNIKYGSFITNVINFIIMAFVIFVIIKGLNKLTHIGKNDTNENEEKTTKTCPYCLSEIPINAVKCAYCTSELEKE